MCRALSKFGRGFRHSLPQEFRQGDFRGHLGPFGIDLPVFPEKFEGLLRLEHFERPQPLIDQDHVVLGKKTKLSGLFRCGTGGGLFPIAGRRVFAHGRAFSGRRQDTFDELSVQPDNRCELFNVLKGFCQLPDPLGKGEGDRGVRFGEWEGGRLLAVFGAVYHG